MLLKDPSYPTIPIEHPKMLDIWSWICELPDSAGSCSSSVLELARSMPDRDGLTQSIQLRANWTACEPSSEEAAITFSLYLLGFESQKLQQGPIWVSDPYPLSSDKPFLPLLLQLLREIISRSPTTQESTCPRSRLGDLRPEPVAWIMDSHAPESLSGFFNSIFLLRLFWLCSFDAPCEAGTFYYHCLLAPNLETLACNRTPVLRKFLATIGVDAELCFTRAFSYMLAKWLILREVGGVGLKTLASLPADDRGLVVSYATEAHGLWILKGYVPIQAMKVTQSSNQLKSFPITEAKDSVLKYVLAHQQLEAVIQVEYSVKFFESYIQGSFGKTKVPKVKTTARTSSRTRIRNWRWDQDAEGNAAVFDGVLCDSGTGREVATCRPGGADGGSGFHKRYAGAQRPFTKTGGVIFAGDECGRSVVWRLSREMEGSVMKWRIGGQIWLTYWPNNNDVIRSSPFETRAVELCDEVDLPLIPGKVVKI
ncbi:hypothetical protein CRG98_007988 [Punica granatum]|uniref:Uncharacterized protein n=1 Tax=Punica granatum TaxID=22663 RepID=A0A2I0KT60_PUNGR|nr:hypothetical protein CRG98_007988 [Punica granatum]